MVWTHRGQPIPLEIYHGVPAGWYAEEVLVTHRALGGRFDLAGPTATEPGAPHWLPERHPWLQYRAILYRVADGVRAGDGACIELAVRYIELRYIGSYSGFIRERLARALKGADLSPTQAARLDRHFRKLLTERERTVEFREFFRLWRSISSEAERAAIVAEFGARSDAAHAWLVKGLALDTAKPSPATTGDRAAQSGPRRKRSRSTGG